MSLKIGLLTGACLLGISLSDASCNLIFNKCPGDFTAQTITVPNNVVWLDPVIPVCNENVPVQTGTNTAPPSIMFIIDNSGSMNDNDPTTSRFDLIRKSLLDSIYRNAPNAEVGLVIFSRRLQFDDRDPGIFKSAFPGDATQHDAYVPLTPLKQIFANGKTGIDSLKKLLEYTGKGDLNHATKYPASRANTGTNIKDSLDIRNGTDITLGFETAKLGMQSAKAGKENQFFIFLSDGEPSSLDDIRRPLELDFIQGKNSATTFTVYYSNAVPKTIADMTANIKTNQYSITNPQSNYWAVGKGSELLTLITENILNPIFSSVPAKAASGTLTVGSTVAPNLSVDANNFNFGKRVALTGDPTQVKLDYNYTFTDAGVEKTKLVSYTINVKRSAKTALDSGLSQRCSESATIGLTFNGAPIQIVTADHDSLGLKVTLPSGQVCTGCKAEVIPSVSNDKETVVLSPVGSEGVGTFNRKTSNTPATGNGILENLPSDSIVITWVNPENSLDVVRKAFPYSDIASALNLRPFGDVAKPLSITTPVQGQQFILVAPTSLNANPEGAPRNWALLPSVPDADLKSYVGIEIETSRAFRASMSIYSNLGQFVNKIDFSLTQPEFEKLAGGSKQHSRKMALLWDNRAKDGSLAGTGGYLLKTDITLLKIAGIADDEVLQSDLRRVGLIRPH